MACDLCKLLEAPAEGVIIWGDQLLVVINVDEAEYPGYTRVVWREHVREMTDLTAAQRQHVMAVVWAVEQAQRAVMAPHKINLASFGNMTPHVHWHVIRAIPTTPISLSRPGRRYSVLPIRPCWRPAARCYQRCTRP